MCTVLFLFIDTSLEFRFFIESLSQIFDLIPLKDKTTNIVKETRNFYNKIVQIVCLFGFIIIRSNNEPKCVLRNI